MKLRPLLLSLAILAPVAGAVWWLQRPAPATADGDPRLHQRVADPALIANAARVRIESGGKSAELARGENNRWTLLGEPVLPADTSKLNRLVSDLIEPKIERLVSSNPERIATLDLESAGITFLDADGKTLIALDLGKNADGGGRFLRYGDEAKAYLARINLYLDAEPGSWRDTTLVAGLKEADVASVSITFPDTAEPVLLSRTAADAVWTSPATPAGRQVKASALSSPLGSIGSLRFTHVAPAIDATVTAASPHPRELSVTTFDGRVVKLTFTRAPEPPPAPKPELKEGETAPPEPPAPPRPVYVAIDDSKEDAILAQAGKTHAFEVAEWLFTSLPSTPDALFEPVPGSGEPAAASEETKPEPATATTGPISVTTEPMTVEP